MKRITGLVLALLMLCGLGVTALADEEPVPVNVPPQSECDIYEGSGIIDVYNQNQALYIPAGEHTVRFLDVHGSDALIIGKGAKVTITVDFENEGTIYVLGELNIDSEAYCYNYGTIYLFSEEGKINGKSFTGDGSFIQAVCSHTWVDGICEACGAKAENTTASVISEGYLPIVTGIAGLAVGIVGTLLVTRKKKEN